MEDPQNDIRVSVCCLTYNHANYITECLEGILRQNVDFKYEILIHDDCSTDGTTAIIREYQKKYPEIIKPYIQKENRWSKNERGFNFHYNFSRAKGRYIAICEGDDYWTDPDKLHKQITFLENNDDYSMTFHNARLITLKNSDGFSLFSAVENRTYSQIEVFEKWLVPTASMVFKKEVSDHQLFKKIHDEQDLIYGDNILLVTSSLVGKLRGFASVMSVYRKHEGGVSYKIDREIVRALDRQNILFAKYFPSLESSTDKILLNRCITHLKISIKTFNFKDAIYFTGRFISVIGNKCKSRLKLW